MVDEFIAADVSGWLGLLSTINNGRGTMAAYFALGRAYDDGGWSA
jgi:hypothetical protein